MANAFFKLPDLSNEKVLDFRPGSPEKAALKAALEEFMTSQTEVFQHINGQKISTDTRVSIHPPHLFRHELGHFHKGAAVHVQQAIDAALKAKPAWEALSWEDRAAIFLKAADLLAGPYRAKMNAATMLGQSKNVFQAEIDCVAELCDFWRLNAAFMAEIFSGQPQSTAQVWNRMEYRPLEGFVFAITPFNFTSIAGNLPAAPALLGNTIIWKPAETQTFSAAVIMEVLEAAGLPPGVINLILVDGPVAGDIIFSHPDFAGLHFTGSTKVFQSLWHTIGTNISKYRSYPRIVGETGGKDFVLAHPSADVQAVVTALARGAFEYQGQKCSAASRAYIPKSLWKEVSAQLAGMVDSFRMGSPEQFGNFINAVIDGRAFDKITNYIAEAKKSDGVSVLTGGTYQKTEGYFIKPTVLVCEDPKYRTMQEEIFGPVLSIYVYPDKKFNEVLELIDQTSPYALTGAVFSQDRQAIAQATQRLRHAAGNFYINDKPTGAVVGQQPFGGARGSGTNDKAGSVLNLYRWLSPRAIKENFLPPTDYRYPFMLED